MRDNPGKRVTIKDIARIANVSPASVSMVINERPGVSRDTRERVQEIIEALKYSPNLVARSLVRRRSDAIAMLITSPLNPIFPELAAGVDEVLKKHGYSLSIISTYDNEEMEAKEIQKIRARGIDGIITSAALLEGDSLRILVKSGYPVVSVLRRVYNCEDLDFVTVDNLKGGYMAAEHLIRLGHTKIGIIKGPGNTSTGRERFEGGLMALEDYGLPITNGFIQEGDYFKESGHMAAQRLLNTDPARRPTAIFATNDEMAFGAFEAIWDHGLKIPEEVALVGFNNVDATALRRVEITTVSQRKQEMGRLAANRLIAKIERKRGYKKPYRIILEPRLIVRKSCGFSIASKYLLKKETKRYRYPEEEGGL
jgi:LacI family transcriptional regulator